MNFQVTQNRNKAEVLEAIGYEEKSEEKKYIVMNKFSPVPYAEELMKKEKFVFDKYKILWRFEYLSGLWIENAEQYIRTSLRKNLMGDEQQKNHYIGEIISYIQDIVYDEKFEMDNSPYLIPFKNKVYDLEKEKFTEFSPDFYLSNKLDIEIDENIKECPLIDEFFIESVGEKYKQILYDLIAYSLFKAIPYQKLFFIYGPAGTGKSVFMSLFEKFLGDKNICSVEPKQIQNDKYATAQMEYKYANIVSDINYDEFENITQVKKLSGTDTLTIRKMYKDPYNRKLFTKQIYSTNKMPVVREKTNAWYRRVYLCQFPNIIKSESRDLFLLNKLTSKKELQGLAFKCLTTLKNLYKNKFVFTFDIDELEMASLYEELSNPILMFIKENCFEKQNAYVFKWEFDERLNHWLKNNHFPTSSKTEINRYMREKYNESQRSSFGTDKNYRVWTGLRWSEKKDKVLLNGFNHFTYLKEKVYIYREKFATPCKSVKSVKLEENKPKGEGFNSKVKVSADNFDKNETPNWSKEDLERLKNAESSEIKNEKPKK